jgi:hypothetical protein
VLIDVILDLSFNIILLVYLSASSVSGVVLVIFLSG